MSNKTIRPCCRGPSCCWRYFLSVNLIWRGLLTLLGEPEVEKRDIKKFACMFQHVYPICTMSNKTIRPCCRGSSRHWRWLCFSVNLIQRGLLTLLGETEIEKRDIKKFACMFQHVYPICTMSNKTIRPCCRGSSRRWRWLFFSVNLIQRGLLTLLGETEVEKRDIKKFACMFQHAYPICIISNKTIRSCCQGLLWW